MITKYEIEKYTAYTQSDNDIFYDGTAFAYVYGDCETVGSFDDEDEAFEAWNKTNDYHIWIGDYESGEYEVVCYGVREVTYDDEGNLWDMGELVYS